MEDLLEEYRSATRTDNFNTFIRKHPGMYLLGEVPPHAEESSWSFRTGVTDMKGMEAFLSGQARLGEPGMKAGFFLLKVEKCERNKWSSWVTVGRAPNNDVVLRHSCISKLHAQIQLRPDSDGQVEYGITDANSTNGTCVNERRQDSSRLTRLKSGDRLRFGFITCDFLDASDLYDRLRRLPPSRSLDLDF